MNASVSAILGIVFLLLSVTLTFLMFYLWSFPFDAATRTSAAPKSLMRVHRGLGYAYVGIYILMMTQMVPRMWQYQVEFPPRTVAHLVLGLLIGALLILKIAILQFFRHFEKWMPAIGTSLFICTLLLIGLSIPSVARERALASSAVGGGIYSSRNRQRVAALLPLAGFGPPTPLQPLTTASSLRAGRAILLDQCVRCHDLKTILARPRTPSDWLETVRRMAAKPALFAPISEPDQERVCAYLIAITPDLQKSAELRPKQADDRLQPPERIPTPRRQNGAPAVKLLAARAAFGRVCSQCHSLDRVDQSPPRTATAIQALIQRMRANGMQASAQEAELIRLHLTTTCGIGR